jgi:MtN3 and saliva related transmembrane protein
MDGVTILGLIAAILVNAAFVPQAIKSWKTKKTEDLSLIMYFVYVTGIGLWLVYGIITVNIPIIFSESIGLLLVFSVLYLKIRYG